MFLFDSHAHLNLPDFDQDREECLARARAAGVTRMVNVGVDAETARRAREMARSEAGLFASAAIHPNYVARHGEKGFLEVRELLLEGGFKAVGETGLDYYRDHSPHEGQRESFRRHLALASELSLPVIVHCRDAHEDCLRILGEEMGPRGLEGRVVMHCYGGSVEDAIRYVELGTFVSFSGVVTFPNARANREAAAAVPLDRLLAETDCPYLAPQPRRGKRNEPAFVGWVVKELAGVHRIDPEEEARITTENACRFFGVE